MNQHYRLALTSITVAALVAIVSVCFWAGYIAYLAAIDDQGLERLLDDPGGNFARFNFWQKAEGQGNVEIAKGPDFIYDQLQTVLGAQGDEYDEDHSDHTLEELGKDAEE